MNTRNDSYVAVVDISRWQKSLAAKPMAQAGVAGVIVRSSDGGKGVDPMCLPFVREASTSPLFIGTYHFIRPKLSTPTEQARFWLSTVRKGVNAIGRPLDLPLMADVEQYWKSTKPLPGPAMVRWLAEFLDVVESEGADLVRATARTPIIYTGAPFWSTFVGNSDAFGRYNLVLARYPTYRLVKGPDGDQRAVDHQPPANAATWPTFAWNLRANPSPILPPGWSKWDGWQFSADGNRGGKQVGVGSPHVDCNIFLTESIRRWTGTSPAVLGKDIAPAVSTLMNRLSPISNPTEDIVNSLPDLKPGARSDHVKRAQALLLAAGFNPGALDGIYTTAVNGPTRLAVQAFQASRGLVQDANIGVKQTWPALLGV